MKSANGSLVTTEDESEIRKTTAVRSRCRGLTSTGLLMEAARCLHVPKPGQQNLTLNEARKRRASGRHRVRCKRELDSAKLERKLFRMLDRTDREIDV